MNYKDALRKYGATKLDAKGWAGKYKPESVQVELLSDEYESVQITAKNLDDKKKSWFEHDFYHELEVPFNVTNATEWFFREVLLAAGGVITLSDDVDVTLESC